MGFRVISSSRRESVSRKKVSTPVDSCVSRKHCSGTTRHPNDPDPMRFEIKRHWGMGRFVVLFVNYPNCTNYEGNKILIFENISLKEIRSWRNLDPHFLDDGKSPIARFRPDTDGWEKAKRFIQMML